MIESIRFNLLLLGSFWTFTSCIVPESTHVNPTFHLLTKSIFDNNQSVPQPSDLLESNYTSSGRPFYLRQIELPYYLQESRIVSRPDEANIEFRENDRWGEPLLEGIGRVVGLNLSQILNSPFYSVYPHRKKIGTPWEVSVTMLRFEKVSKSTVKIEASWEIFNIDFKNGAYPLQNGKVNTVVFIKPSGLKSQSIEHEIDSLSKSLRILSELISASIISSTH
jgi:uncharacterized lipoprotein YmbA